METNLAVKEAIEKCVVSSKRDVMTSAAIFLLGLSSFYITLAFWIQGTGNVYWLHISIATICSLSGYFHLVSSYFWWRVCSVTIDLARITGMDIETMFIVILDLTNILRGDPNQANRIIEAGIHELQSGENRNHPEVQRLKKILLEVSGYYHVGESTLKEIKEKQAQS